MAEFCLECFNELNGTHYTKGDVILEFDFCENCGKYRKCIGKLREHGPLNDLIGLLINIISTTDPQS